MHKFTLISNPEFVNKESNKKDIGTIDQRILQKQVGKYSIMNKILNDDTLVFRDKMVGYGKTTKMLTSNDLQFLILGN